MRKPNKYRAQRTTVDGITFDSKKEAERYQQLKLLEVVGEIINLRRQVALPLVGQHGPIKTRTGRQMRLTVDFVYEEWCYGWKTIYEEVKGTRTRDYEVRRAVVQAMGIDILET